MCMSKPTCICVMDIVFFIYSVSFSTPCEGSSSFNEFSSNLSSPHSSCSPSLILHGKVLVFCPTKLSKSLILSTAWRPLSSWSSQPPAGYRVLAQCCVTTATGYHKHAHQVRGHSYIPVPHSGLLLQCTFSCAWQLKSVIARLASIDCHWVEFQPQSFCVAKFKRS